MGRASLATNVIPAQAGTQFTERRGIAINGAMPKQPCVYIMASKRNGTLYIGVTSDLFQRVGLHKQDLIDGFTKRYGVHRLVYYEMHERMDAAIRREKQLKKWNRAWKLRLIESMNPSGATCSTSSGARSMRGRRMSREKASADRIWSGDWVPAFVPEARG